MLFLGTNVATQCNNEFYSMMGIDINDKDYRKWLLGQGVESLEDEGFTIKIANAIWLEKDFKCKQEYIDEITRRFKSSLINVNFTDTIGTKNLLNEWASENTNKLPIISENPPLRVDKIIQQVYLSVKEEGTEAAAVTVSEMVVGCLPPEEEEHIEMNVNHSFVYAIKNKIAGNILFAGVVNKL